MTDVQQLTCQELVELVTDYFEGSLASEQRLSFEAHVAACAGCGVHLDQMRRTIELTGRLAADDVSPEAEEALRAAFREWRAGSASA